MERRRFREVEFIASPFYSPADKAKFANRLVDFIVAGMPQHKFSKVLYNDLSTCFGFLGEFDVHGFAYQHFSSPERKLRFIEQILTARIYGDPHFSRADVETAIQRWLQHSDAHAWARAEAQRASA